MRIDAEHLQEWIRAPRGFHGRCVGIGEFEQYLDGLPWAPSRVD